MIPTPTRLHSCVTKIVWLFVLHLFAACAAEPTSAKCNHNAKPEAVDGAALSSAMSSLLCAPKRIEAILFSKMEWLCATSC